MGVDLFFRSYVLSFKNTSNVELTKKSEVTNVEGVRRMFERTPMLEYFMFMRCIFSQEFGTNAEMQKKNIATQTLFKENS